MKILHTSDWHLGHTLYDYERMEEQSQMLDQMVEIVRVHRPDVFLVSGDIFHSAVPSATMQTLFSKALVRIHDAYPDVVMVVTAGNHDSGLRHEIFREPWLAFNVHAIGKLNKEHLDQHIVEIPGKGFVVAVPYCNDREMPVDLYQQMLNLVGERNTENLPVVMSAHTTVSGCDFSGHENASNRNVGGIDSIPVNDMGEGYDYLALGHIHIDQFIHSNHHHSVRYSGTPLPVSFDERLGNHTVSLVTIEKHGAEPQVETIEIQNPFPLVSIPQDTFVKWDDALALLRAYHPESPSYIRLNVETEGFLPPTAFPEAAQLAKDKQCKLCYINLKRTTQGQVLDRQMDINEFNRTAPVDIAKLYAKQIGCDFDQEMEKLFAEAESMVENDEREKNA